MTNNGWIKIHRQITEWEWYSDANTFRLFMHLLITANRFDKSWQGIEVLSGQLITSVASLKSALKLSEAKIILSIKKLKSTGEITTKTTSKYTMIELVNWRAYQIEGEQNHKQDHKQTTNESQTNHKQITTNKKVKNIKKEKNNIYNLGEFDLSRWPEQPTDEQLVEISNIRKFKKKPLSQIAVNRMGTELTKAADAGFDFTDCLEYWIMGQWQGFKFEYIQNKPQAKKAANQTVDDLMAEMRGEKKQENVIDV